MSEKGTHSSILAHGEMPKLEATALERAKQLEHEPVNVGEPPINSRKQENRNERYTYCEDAKINDPEHGLFMVADGVSGVSKTGTGKLASTEMACSAQEHLGKNLDQEIENLRKRTDIAPDELDQNVDLYIKTQFRTAMVEADQKIKRIRESGPKRADCATTATLLKIADMPSGEQFLYLANIGDSRAFILRDGTLHKLTIDDSAIADHLRGKFGLNDTMNDIPEELNKKNQLFRKSLQQIEQASSAQDLPAEFAPLFRFRNVIRKSVGDGKSAQTVDVQRFQLQKGDKILLASDGITDVLFEQEIQELLASASDDRSAEKVLQNTTDEIGLRNDRKRAKVDDISAVVYTVEERESSKETDIPVTETAEQAVAEYQPTEQDVQAWTTKLRAIGSEILSLLRRIEQIQDPSEKTELEIKMADFEMEEARLEYWLSKVEKDSISEETPHRFDQGQPVRLPSRFAGKGGQGRGGIVENWQVQAFSKEKDQYLVSNGGASMFVDRYELELSQDQLHAKPNDKIMVKRRDQSFEKDWTVMEVSSGSVFIGKEIDGKIKHKMVDSEFVSDALKRSIGRAYDLGVQMEKASQRLTDVAQKKTQLEQSLQDLEQQRAREQAERAASR